MAVIFGMRKAQLDETVAAIVRATFPVATDKSVAWLNHIAIWGFVIGAIFLCLFVGINLL